MRNALIGLLVLVATTPAWAADTAEQDTLKAGMAKLATKVKEVCGGLKPSQTSVAIGEFGRGGQASTLGVGVGAVTSELAAALGKFADPSAPLELSGKVFIAQDPDKKLAGTMAIRVTELKLSTKSGDEVAVFKDFDLFIRNAADFDRILAPTVVHKPDDKFEGKTEPNEGRRQETFESLPKEKQKPAANATAFVDGSIVRSHKDSLYDVELLCGPEAPKTDAAKKKFAALKPTLTDKQFPGLPVVDIPANHYFQVKVTNRDTRRLGVFLHLDGIDQFAFSEDRNDDGSPKYKLWVIDAGESLTIAGYHKSLKRGEVFGFLTTQHGEGAVSKFPTLGQGGVGTIRVGLAPEVQPGEKGPVESTPGEVIPFAQKETVFKLSARGPKETVSFRYTR